MFEQGFARSNDQGNFEATESTKRMYAVLERRKDINRKELSETK